MKKFVISLALAVFATVASTTFADVPQLLNYQGNLSAPDGTPKNGSFTMMFSVYDAETGGNQLPIGTPWAETHSSVTVTNGVFNVLLGSVTALPATLFEGGPMDSAGPLRFLNVVVSGETLAPRKRIGSSSYAIRAGAIPLRDVDTQFVFVGSKDDGLGTELGGSSSIERNIFTSTLGAGQYGSAALTSSIAGPFVSFDNDFDLTIVARISTANPSGFKGFVGLGSGYHHPGLAGFASSSHVGFLLESAAVTATSASGGQQTTIIPAISPQAWITYRILYRAGVSAEFFIDGALVATHTVELPVGSNVWLNMSLYGGTNGGGGRDMYVANGYSVALLNYP